MKSDDMVDDGPRLYRKNLFTLYLKTSKSSKEIASKNLHKSPNTYPIILVQIMMPLLQFWVTQ